MIQVIVDRKTWYRGKGGTQSRLVRPFDNKKCCIGFLGLALGLTEEEMNDEPDLTGVCNNGASDEASVFNYDHEGPLFEAYKVNDATTINDTAREAKLIELGKAMDVQFTFIN